MLSIVKGEGSKAVQRKPLTGLLAAAWKVESEMTEALIEVADATTDRARSARLRVLSAFCRAHSSRLLARLSAIGKGPLPVPQKIPADLTVLKREAGRLAKRYFEMAELARTQSDLSSAWTCELNRVESEDMLKELSK